MVPPQNADLSATNIIKTEIDYGGNEYKSTLVNNNDRNVKISLKSAEELYSRDRLIKHEFNNDVYNSNNAILDNNKLHNNDQLNGYNLATNDANYFKVKEKVIVRNVLPNELEFGDNKGVFAKTTIIKGTKYGPFQGKWAGIPQNSKFAWEVSDFYIIICFKSYENR